MIQMTSQRTWAVRDSAAWWPVVGWYETEEGAAPLIFTGDRVISGEGAVRMVTVAQWEAIAAAVSVGAPLASLEPERPKTRPGSPLQDAIVIELGRARYPMSTAAIGRALERNSGSVFRALASLEQRGLVQRHPVGNALRWTRTGPDSPKGAGAETD